MMVGKTKMRKKKVISFLVCGPHLDLLFASLEWRTEKRVEEPADLPKTRDKTDTRGQKGPTKKRDQRGMQGEKMNGVGGVGSKQAEEK